MQLCACILVGLALKTDLLHVLGYIHYFIELAVPRYCYEYSDQAWRSIQSQNKPQVCCILCYNGEKIIAKLAQVLSYCSTKYWDVEWPNCF